MKTKLFSAAFFLPYSDVCSSFFKNYNIVFYEVIATAAGVKGCCNHSQSGHGLQKALLSMTKIIFHAGEWTMLIFLPF